MTLADIKGNLEGEFADQASAVNVLIAEAKAGTYQLGGLDWEGRFRASFIEVSDGGNGCAVVHVTDRPGHRWHYATTPWPKSKPLVTV